MAPEKEHSCPDDAQPCYTLSHIVEQPMNYFPSDTKIIFLPGNHTTNTNGSIVIAKVSNITLEGRGSTIQCTKGREVGFVFIDIRNLSITNLHLDQCGAKLPDKVEQLYNHTVFSQLYLSYKAYELMYSDVDYKDFYTKSFPALYLIQVSTVTISWLNIYNSSGPGLLGFNLMGHSTISQSFFIRNHPNCALLLNDTALQSLSILDSKILFGEYNRKTDFKIAAGLTIIFYIDISLNISNVTIHSSNDIGYRNVLLTNMSKVTIRSESYGNILLFSQEDVNVTINIHKLNSSYSNGAMFMDIAAPLAHAPDCNIVISESVFNHNIHDLGVTLIGKQTCTVTLENITFHNNSLALEVTSITAILNNINFTYNIPKYRLNPITISFCNVTIKGNNVFIENRGNTAAVVILDSYAIFQGNTTFLRNRGKTAGAIHVTDSQLYFEDNIQFVENVGYDGGALAFHETTYNSNFFLTIAHNLKANFTRNHARHYGGAIYVVIGKIIVEKQIKCFYKPDVALYTSSFNHTSFMVFTNNTSEIAGSAIFGGWVQLCYIEKYEFSKKILMYTDGKMFFNKTFQFTTDSSDLSPVSSEPVRVCICTNSKPDCNITHHTVKAYPGEMLQISAVGVGQMYGTVPATVHAQFHQTNAPISPKFESLQHVQIVQQFCTYLSYTVQSPNTAEDIDLIVESNMKENRFYRATIPKQFANVVVHVELQPCPLGFKMHEAVCSCHPQLQALGIQCNIAIGKIHRDARFWMNTTFQKGIPVGVLVHQNCPFDYCKPYSLNLSLENPDEQCVFRRSGILCGACQNNLSHVLGSSNCKRCSSLWLILFIPAVAVAGIVLVVFLMLLNLTVSVGTINGLIFYANIVRSNQAAFFPQNTSNSFLSWFIAWMNLDLGFEACFYNGLDAYTKTWLQFVFPMYIWFIVTVIIVSSHYYTTAAKIAGKNAVQVLATLFLLSYAKLMRLTITIFSSTTLENGGSVGRVWLYDGNVDYLKGKHIPLFMAALLVLLVLSLPYTALLLFIQCLQLKSKHRALFWVGKFKPLFDAYTGPYKDKHRYWTGLLLLVRAMLFLVFSVNVFGDPAINMLAIAATMFLLFIYVAVSKHVYKAKHLNMLEYSFLLNLGITSTASLYTTRTTKNQTAVIYTSVGIAFVTFCVILLYHIVIRIKSHFQWITTRMNSLKLRTNRQRRNQTQETDHTAHPPSNPQVPITFIKLREPLLEYCSNN